MRILSTIFIFICLCSTFVGYHLVFNFQLDAVKSGMKAFLKDQVRHKDVVRLSLNETESKALYWENEDEFRYNDEMYDVIEKKVNGKEMIIRCIPDTKETGLLNEYHKNNKHNSSGSSIVQLITAQFLLPVDYLLCLPEKKIEKAVTDHYSSLQNIASSVLLPPPDVC